MKRIFTSSKRLVLSAALVLMSVGSAMAGGDDWYAYHIQAEAYPTGAGLVYVDSVMVDDESAIVYAEQLTREYTMKGSMPTIYGYAEAAEGWQLLGFTKGVIDENGEVIYPADELVVLDSFFPAMLMLSPETGDGVGSKHYDETTGEEVSDDSLTVAAMMPLDPTVYYRALYTHVAVEIAAGQEQMGQVEIDKLVNDLGEKVTLTATPDNEFCSFAGWTLDGEVISKESTLTVDVEGIATYVANFTDSRTITLNFPEEGGYIEWYNDYDFNLDYLVESYVPQIFDGTENDLLSEDGKFLTAVTSGYMVSGKTPAILYGAGEVSISPSSGEEADENTSALLFKWSGETGVDVASLELTDGKLYTFDENTGAFSLITEGTIAPNKVYMQLPDSLVAEGLATPEVIYISETAYQTVDPSAIRTAAKSAAAGKIYDLQGRRLDAMNREGIYIFDGKKVIYRKK